MHYRPEIDGLRTVAVMPVIFFHAGFSWFSGGFVGVDVFFVISGYLITSILLNDLQNDRFSIWTFYERRARRLLPALFVVLLACLPFALMWMVPTQLREFGQALVATALFASNVHFFREAGYFEPASDENVLLHTWSLAVEEQFYIIFPLMLLLIWKFHRSGLLRTIIALACVSLGVSHWGASAFPEANFYLLPTRAWELLAGSVCAVLQRQAPRQNNNVLAAAGLAMIVCAIVVFDEATPFPSFWALFPVMGTVLIIQFAGRGTWVAGILSLRFMVGIGLISYSAYLWHQPLFAFAHIRAIYPLSTSTLLGLSVLALVLAALTWRFVEAPFRTKHGQTSPRLLPRRSALFVTSGFALIGVVALGLTLHVLDGMPGRSVAALRQPLIDTQAETFRSYALVRNEHLEEQRIDAFLDGGIGPKILILGDSHGVDMLNAVLQNLEHYPENTAVLSRDLPIDCGHDAKDDGPERQYRVCAEEFTAANPHLIAAATHIVFSMRWRNVDDPIGLLSGYVPAFDEMGKFIAVLSNTAEFDPPAPDLIRIAGFEANYGTAGPFPKAATDRMFWAQIDPAVIDLNRTLRAHVEDNLGVQYLDKFGIICDASAQRCESTTANFEAVYYDYGHWTLAGAEYVGRLMVQQGWPSFFRTQ